MRQSIKDKIDRLVPEMIKVRHHIHLNPELAGEEASTARTITDVLENFGYNSITTNIAGNGISAILDSGKTGKTVAIRSELDALPILEKINAPYESKIDGKMHACGHDGHIAIALTVAGALINCKEHFKGKIKFIFQPAEETAGSGALAMIEAGILENPKVDAIFGCHTTHRYDANKLATRVGCLISGHSTFTINIKGCGGYVSSPTASDPVYIGSLIVQALQNIKNRIVNPLEPLVVSVTKFNAGIAHNTIPNEATLIGSIRTVTFKSYMQIRQQITDIIMGIVKSMGATAEIYFQDNSPPGFNTLHETDVFLSTAKQILGEANIFSQIDTIMAPEGFSYYLEKVPGCFFLIGNGPENGIIHREDYKFNDNTIPIAAEILAMAAVNYLNTSNLQ
jgi:amidohydrolase